MDKQHIIHEINRTAAANGGAPLGQNRFFIETGIKINDWLGKYWARWGDALIEAGFPPNKFVERKDDSLIIEKVVLLARELGRLPVKAEMQLKHRKDSSFPSYGAIARRGTKQELITHALEFCRQNADYEDVEKILANSIERQGKEGSEIPKIESNDGFVYLIRYGRFYKLGRTNALGRRERELAIQLPEKAVTVHAIKTDDPIGIEAYWHKRFEAQRRNGEWFELSAAEVHAFKRRKFM